MEGVEAQAESVTQAVQSGTDRVLDVDAVTACGVSSLATAVAINVNEPVTRLT